MVGSRFADPESEQVSRSDQRVRPFKQRSRLEGSDLPEGEGREAALRRRKYVLSEPEARGASPLNEPDQQFSQGE